MPVALYSIASARSSENVRRSGRVTEGVFPRTPVHSFRRNHERRRHMRPESPLQKISLRPPLGLCPSATVDFVRQRVGYGLPRPLIGFRNWTRYVTKLHHKVSAKLPQALDTDALLATIKAFLATCRSPA